MITNAFLDLAVWTMQLFFAAVSSLPDVTLPTGMQNVLASMAVAIKSIDVVFPISTLLAAIAIVIGIWVAYFVYMLILSVLKKIPFLNIK